MKTLKEKRINAIAGYEAAIARHNADLESAGFRLKGYTKAQLAGEPDRLIAACIEAVKETISIATDKIKKLNDLVYHTSQKLGYGDRG